MFHSPSKQHSSTSDIPSRLELETLNITQRKRKQPESDMSELMACFTSQLNSAVSDLGTLMNEKLSEISRNIGAITLDMNTLKNTTMAIKEELNSIRNDHVETKSRVSVLEEKQDQVARSVRDLESAINYNTNTYSDLQKQVKNLESRTRNQDPETLNRLDIKMEYLEQQARQSNVELCNVPEKRGENLLMLTEKLGSLINYPITNKDIISIHRVPHAQKEITRPKNIIIKFSSKIFRDNVLSAFRRKKTLCQII